MTEKKPITNPVKAIRAFCIECSGGNAREASNCPEEKCVLHSFRRGTNPFRTKRVLTEEQREAAAERFRQYRESKSDETVL